MTMTRTGKSATQEQREAAAYLGSLEDPLAPWVRSVGTIDAYDAHLPVTVTDPLEWFAYSITSRQLSHAASLAIYQRLVERLGGAVTPERVLQAGEHTLREAGLSERKSWTIRALAELMFDGGLDAGTLATMTDDDILGSLVAVPGIGPSSAQRFLLHFLHRPDVLLVSDPTLREALTAVDQLDRPIAPKAAERRGEAWHPFRSYATTYLWGYAYG
ncbi:hypothetical protein GCM10027568_28270 [Humibacter soli]